MYVKETVGAILTEEVWSFLTQWMLTPYSVYRGPRLFQDGLTIAMGYSMHTSGVGRGKLKKNVCMSMKDVDQSQLT